MYRTVASRHPAAAPGPGTPRLETPRLKTQGGVEALSEAGIDAVLASSETDIDAVLSVRTPQIVLLDCSALGAPDVRRCLDSCVQARLPLILLVPGPRMRELVHNERIADFLVLPFLEEEMVARAGRVLRDKSPPEGSDVIREGDLVINPTNYEVALKGRRIALRFKEYELLRLLATSPGRVFTRDALLRKIWGYDYFGGTRTVDVHIRRLRSKIEDAEHSFIETIWAVGYRFRDMSRSS